MLKPHFFLILLFSSQVLAEELNHFQQIARNFAMKTSDLEVVQGTFNIINNKCNTQYSFDKEFLSEVDFHLRFRQVIPMKNSLHT